MPQEPLQVVKHVLEQLPLHPDLHVVSHVLVHEPKQDEEQFPTQLPLQLFVQPLWQLSHPMPLGISSSISHDESNEGASPIARIGSAYPAAFLKNFRLEIISSCCIFSIIDSSYV